MNKLTEILRPKTIDDIVGQQHLLGENKAIDRMLKSKCVSSMILYSKPGTGKTSIANALANSLNLECHTFNASIHDKQRLKDFAKTVEQTSSPIVIALDEIHRLDKTKQDFLLPYVESGEFIIIGATTENPYISVSPALRSRVQIFKLEELDYQDMLKILNKAINYYADRNISISDGAIKYLINRSNRDVRVMLTTFQVAAETSKDQIEVEDIQSCMGEESLDLDLNGDNHYNLLSAFQKSIRGSHVDAALHYLAKLILSGDLESIIRRLKVIAYEDIGLAEPNTVNNAIQAINTAKEVGLPECRIALSYAVILLTLSQKSNIAYEAIDMAIEDAKNIKTTVPDNLKDTHFKGAKDLGHVGYIYPHDFDNYFVQQQYLPSEISNKQYLDKLITKKMKSSHEKLISVNYETSRKLLET